MSRKKISSTIYITPEQSERLKLLHHRTKVPISVYIREGIDLVLKQYESVLPGQMSLVAETALPLSAATPTLPGFSGVAAAPPTAAASPGPAAAPMASGPRKG